MYNNLLLLLLYQCVILSEINIYQPIYLIIFFCIIKVLLYIILLFKLFVYALQS
jgi:hypothetical protein